MKRGVCQLALAGAAALLLTGCFLRSSTVPVRHFLLAPLSTNQPPAGGSEPLTVGIGLVRMPSYLLRDSLAVRNNANEIEYLEGAVWGERLDQCFQRTLAVNLSRLLASNRIYSSDWGRNQVLTRVYVSVQQFDVDIQGKGTLIADWRIGAPNSDQNTRSGTTRLERSGASPHTHPEVIAATLSELLAEFSNELASLIRTGAKRE